MAKKLKIDYSEDRLLSIASDLMDEHDYLGALKMLNRNVNLGNCSAETYMYYADCYDDMGLYEKCVNNWFKYLDNYEGDDFSEINEGLAMAYMNLGQNEVSAFYYNRLLISSGEVGEADRHELLKSFLGDEKNPLRVVYPPEKADFTEELSKGVDAMRESKFTEAVEIFSEIPEGNPSYLTARNYMAMCHVMSENYDEAEDECRNILSRDENNLQALISYSAVKSERGDKTASVGAARRLLDIKTDDPEDIYKIATVCCENGLHAEAYGLFCRLDGDMRYDFNMLYFKAIAAFNSGNTQDAVKVLQTLLIIYPDAVTARRTLQIVKQRIEDGAAAPLSYFYRLPLSEREQNIKMLIEFDKLNKTETLGYCNWEELYNVIKWCIDEADSRADREMLRAAALTAIKSGLDEIVRDLLLNAFIADDIKIGMLQKLCERNEDNNFGVVICNVYRSVDMYKVKLGRAKRKIFLSAYAGLVCRFSLVDSEYGTELAAACENLYSDLEAREMLNLCTDEATISAAIFDRANLKINEIFQGDICAFFGANRELFDKIKGD